MKDNELEFSEIYRAFHEKIGRYVERMVGKDVAKPEGPVRSRLCKLCDHVYGYCRQEEWFRHCRGKDHRITGLVRQ